MSAKSVTKAPSNLPTVPTNFRPINPVPDKAPVPQTDLDNPHLTWDDALPSNFFSMEGLQQWLDERDAESRILTVTSVSFEYVYDPEKGVDTGDWKPCLAFEETSTMLVINKSRAEQLKKLTGSPLLSRAVNLGKIAIMPGIANSKAQIVIKPVPGETNAASNSNGGRRRTLEEINDDLFQS